MKGTLGNYYIIKKTISEGGSFSIVYLVQDKKKYIEYAAKVNQTEDDVKYIKNEADIISELYNKSPYIINMIESGKGKLNLKGEIPIDKNYIILEYCSRGMLDKFLTEKGFEEIFCKIIFKKILNGVKEIHNAKIAHLDLKNQNILLDQNYNIKIADFGVSLKESSKYNLKKISSYTTGTPCYNSPQVIILDNKDYLKKIPIKSYNGYKNDIYSLGIILFILLTGKIPFKNLNHYINAIKKMDSFFTKFKTEKKLDITFSDNFKELFKKMISYKENLRPSIEEILDKDKWFEEIRKLSQEELNQLENKLIEEYKNREEIIEAKNKENIEVKNNINDIYMNTRGINSEVQEKFTSAISPYNLKDDEYLDNYIKIKGSFTWYSFMNSLSAILNENYLISYSENKPEFYVFKEDENDENLEIEDINYIINEEKEIKKEKYEKEGKEEEENNDNLLLENIPKQKEVKIKIALYKKSEEEYYLRFSKLSGEWREYYDVFQNIASIVKNIL